MRTADFFRRNALLAGLAAMMCTYLVGLYYIVILAWTIFYLGRTSFPSEYNKRPWAEPEDCGCLAIGTSAMERCGSRGDLPWQILRNSCRLIDLFRDRGVELSAWRNSQCSRLAIQVTCPTKDLYLHQA